MYVCMYVHNINMHLYKSCVSQASSYLKVHDMYVYAYSMFEGLNNLHIYVPMYIRNKLNVFYSLQQKHQIMEREIEGRRPHFQTVCQNGEKLKSEAVHASKAIGLRIITLQE